MCVLSADALLKCSLAKWARWSVWYVTQQSGLVWLYAGGVSRIPSGGGGLTGRNDSASWLSNIKSQWQITFCVHSCLVNVTGPVLYKHRSCHLISPKSVLSEIETKECYPTYCKLWLLLFLYHIWSIGKELKQVHNENLFMKKWEV